MKFTGTQCTLTSKKRAFYKIISCQSFALLLRERKGVGPIKGGMGDSIAITNNSLNQRETQISSLSKGQPLKTPQHLNMMNFSSALISLIKPLAGLASNSIWGFGDLGGREDEFRFFWVDNNAISHFLEPAAKRQKTMQWSLLDNRIRARTNTNYQ